MQKLLLCDCEEAPMPREILSGLESATPEHQRHPTKTQKRVWCQPWCQWQPLLSLCYAFCFAWHFSEHKMEAWVRVITAFYTAFHLSLPLSICFSLCLSLSDWDSDWLYWHDQILPKADNNKIWHRGRYHNERSHIHIYLCIPIHTNSNL